MNAPFPQAAANAPWAAPVTLSALIADASFASVEPIGACCRRASVRPSELWGPTALSVSTTVPRRNAGLFRTIVGVPPLHGLTKKLRRI